MTATNTTGPAGTTSTVDEYLQSVRAHLGELSDTEAAELIEDLPSHLAEVAASSDEPLDRQLGSPAAFAAELMASAGLGIGARGSSCRQKLWAGAQAVWSAPRPEAVERWRAELRPAWWVARGALAAGVVGGVLSGRDAALRAFPFPVLFGNTAAGLLLGGLAVAASVRLGRVASALGTTRLKRSDLAVSLLVALVAMAAWNQVHLNAGPNYVEAGTEPPPYTTGVLVDGLGNPISNIYPYDRQGLLLHDVLLYDQGGRPVVNHADQTPDGRPIVTTHDTDNNGAEVHAYPLRQSVEPQWSPDGPSPPGAAMSQPVRPPAVVIPPLPPANPGSNGPSPAAPVPPVTG